MKITNKIFSKDINFSIIWKIVAPIICLCIIGLILLRSTSYDSNYDWNWCTGSNGECSDSDISKRRKYDDWRYKSRSYEEIRDFTVAALLINRVISLFNVFRLQFADRISSEFKQYDNDEFELKIFYHF